MRLFTSNFCVKMLFYFFSIIAAGGVLEVTNKGKKISLSIRLLGARKRPQGGKHYGRTRQRGESDTRSRQGVGRLPTPYYNGPCRLPAGRK